MGLLDNIFRKDGDWRETLIRDLFILIEKNEKKIKAICIIAIELGITQERLEYIVHNTNNIKNTYPLKEEELVLYLKYLILFVYGDEKIEEKEEEYFFGIVNKLNLDIEIINTFISNNFNQNKLSTLKDIVVKKNNLSEGIFADINNDLNETFTNLEYRIEKLSYQEKLNYMAYAYARRTAAAGLVLQGVFDLKDFKHAQKFFESIQIQTIHTKEFQENAANYANKYILSYDNRLNINFLKQILVTVYKYPENFKVNKDNGIYYTYEEILESLF